MSAESPCITWAKSLAGRCAAMISGGRMKFGRRDQRCRSYTAKIRWCSVRILDSIGILFGRQRHLNRIQDRIARAPTPAGVFLLTGSILLFISLFSLSIPFHLLTDILSARSSLDAIASYHADVLAVDLLFQFLLGGTVDKLR
jgi:hypothetical protein